MTLGVVGVLGLLGGVLPLVDAYLPVRPDASDLPGGLVLTPDPARSRSVTLVPAPGWSVVERPGAGAADLVSRAGSMSVRSDLAGPSCEADAMRTGLPAGMTTTAGPRDLVTPGRVRGELVSLGSATDLGLVFVGCLDGVRVTVVGRSPLGAAQESLAQVADMIMSLGSG